MLDEATTPGRCENCTAPLSGRATRSCSPRCRQALYRAARALPAVDRKASQDAANEETAKRRYLLDALCGWCDQPTGWAGKGRARKWCSDSCKTAACRSRKANR